MISIYRWSNAIHAGNWLEADDLRTRAAELREAEDSLWIDLDDPTDDEEQLVLGEFLPIHPLIREDMTKLRREPGALPHFPKVEEFADYLFVIVNPLRQGLLDRVRRDVPSAAPVPDDQPSTQLSAVLTRHILITHHYEPLSSVRELRWFLTKHESQAGRGPDYLFHLILDTMVDQYAPVLDHLDTTLDEVEARVLTEPDPGMCQTLLLLKRQVIQLRKTMTYEREVLARLARGEFELIEERETVYYRNVYDHLVRFTELIEGSREMISDLMQIHLSATANKLNEIMKVLTMISTVVLPMALVSGIYGMNFEYLPEIHWRYGYPFALGLMGLLGVGSFLLFRWRRWI